VTVEFRRELPRTIIGKVLRRALRDEAELMSADARASRKAM
jgi:acyl-coenzyme A synthetase/AMP-(fatty) acid ligase